MQRGSGDAGRWGRRFLVCGYCDQNKPIQPHPGQNKRSDNQARQEGSVGRRKGCEDAVAGRRGAAEHGGDDVHLGRRLVVRVESEE